MLTGMITGFLLGYLALSFWLFYRGLGFIAAFFGLGTALTERLMYLLFAFLFVLLLLSNLVISYTNFFRNREANFLLSLPVPAQTIFRWKFLESTLLASWAFLFLIAPLLAAFGLIRQVPWHFYPMTIVSIGLFIVLPAVAGAWCALNLARYLDRRGFQIAAVAAAMLFLVLAAFWWRGGMVSDESLDPRVLAVLDQLLDKTRFAQFAFLPSYWLSSAVLEWSDGMLGGAGFFLLVLLSNVMFFGFLAFTRLGGFYYDAVSQIQSRASVWGQWEWFRAAGRRRRPFQYRRGLVERAVDLLWWVGTDVRALLAKDVRIFWRDTAQWGQTVMLAGLLAVYVMNLRHFTSQLTNPFWIHLVSYLNLGACSLNLATLTTRFVYPQFSLEGQRLWIVGMAPMGLARVVKTKYWLAGCTSLAAMLTLVVLSSYLLRTSWDRVAYFAAVITVMAFSLNGLAAGLGVLYPNLKETNPGKIVSGFGGTFCLVLSFLYILASVLLLAFGSSETHGRYQSPWIEPASIGVFLVLSLVLGWLPLRLAVRRLRNFEC
jgi:ABC-2 type transport system permease protein